jgi:hypothetical protein
MLLRQSSHAPSLPILWNAVKGVCGLVGASAIAAVLFAHHGWIFGPLYAGAVWAWYWIETKVRTRRTFGEWCNRPESEVMTDPFRRRA